MKNIKVKAIFGAWQGYQEIANYPPKGIEYIGISKDTIKGRYYEHKKLKEKLGALLQKLKIPRMIPIKPGRFDLIHSSRGIIPLTIKPWVMDIEHVHSFFGLNPKFIKKRFWKKFIEKTLAKKNCKAILCHCDATKQAFFNYLDCSKFEEKIKVLYPASHILDIKKKKHDKIKILCVLSLFEQKGGLFVLEAFSRLEKKYKNIELLAKADFPEKIKEKYNSKNIKYIPYFGDLVPREELIKSIYAKADIFVYPTFADSFGFSLIDALSVGLPVIATNLFACPEIVQNKKNGFILRIPRYELEKGFFQHYSPAKMTKLEKEQFTRELEKKIEELIKNKKLREKMSKESFKLVNEGKFSIKKRNEVLRAVYEDALK